MFTHNKCTFFSLILRPICTLAHSNGKISPGDWEHSCRSASFKTDLRRCIVLPKTAFMLTVPRVFNQVERDNEKLKY